MVDAQQQEASSKASEPSFRPKDVAPHFVGVPLELQPVFETTSKLPTPAWSPPGDPLSG